MTASSASGALLLARENMSRILQDFMRRAFVSRLAGCYCIENKAAPEREV
jgi:hypothetical protein